MDAYLLPVLMYLVGAIGGFILAANIAPDRLDHVCDYLGGEVHGDICLGEQGRVLHVRRAR